MSLTSLPAGSAGTHAAHPTSQTTARRTLLQLSLGTAASLVIVAVATPAARAQEADASEPAVEASADAVEEALPEIEVVAPGEAQKKKYPNAKKAAKSSSPQQPPKPNPSPSSGASQQSASSEGGGAAGGTEGGAPAASSLAAPRNGTAIGDIVGNRQGVLEAAGSAHVVEAEELYTSHVFTTNEALRKVPGIVVRDEEGMGIRPNIGIRGMNPTRSTKTLLLEDGLFLSYAPYGDNASYFHPSTDRFDHIEVMKGADQILYGPQTISGTINYVTPDPPSRPSGFAALTGGNRDYLNGQVFYGGWFGNAGGLVDYVHKRGDGARDNVEHEIHDAGVKAIYQLAPNSSLIAKVSYFNEDSTVTYSGITNAEARAFGLRYNPFDNDTFDTERFGSSIRHRWDLTPDVGLTTSLYWSTFERYWWRQSSTTTDGQCGAGFTNARLAGSRVDPDDCASIQGRLREYDTWGIDQRFDFRQRLSDSVTNEIKVGWRAHFEDQERLQINGLGPDDRPDFSAAVARGLLREDNERETRARSLFIQDTLDIGPFSIIPAVRFEDIDNKRTNLLAGATCADGSTAPCEGSAETTEVIPGLTLAVAPTPVSRLFVGVHEGFAPPRVEDAIGNDGGTIDVEAEKSINIEAGFKAEVVNGVKLDGTYFRNDFDNLIAVGSVAGGGTPLAQGEALFEGFELAARLDSQRIMSTSWNIYSQTAWTWLWTAEQSTGFRCVDQANAACLANGGFVQGATIGNRLPYAPEHLVTTRLGFATSNFDANVELVFVGDQFADFLNLENGADHPNGSASAEALSGQFGELASQTIVNLGMTYTIEQTDTDLFFSVKNVFDEEYVVDRTRGILPSAPRLFHVGLKQSF